MSRSKLLQQEQNVRPSKRAAAPEPPRSRPAGPGNRDLLSQLGSAKAMPGWGAPRPCPAPSRPKWRRPWGPTSPV